MENNLKTGESSVGQTLFHCTKDQLWRYCESLDYISNNDRVLDLGCGCGYGSLILSHKAKEVIGIDNRKEIIDYANTYYKRKNIMFVCKDGLEIYGKYDVVVAFEVIEHFKDTEKIFKKLKEIAPKIILTVPHISVPNKNKFHYRHFSVKDIEKYMKDINFKIEKIITPKFQGGLAIFCMARSE